MGGPRDVLVSYPIVAAVVEACVDLGKCLKSNPVVAAVVEACVDIDKH